MKIKHDVNQSVFSKRANLSFSHKPTHNFKSEDWKKNREWEEIIHSPSPDYKEVNRYDEEKYRDQNLFDTLNLALINSKKAL